MLYKKFEKFIAFLFLGVMLLYPIISLADMSSSTYRIYADVISIGGGTFSSSTYSLNGTMGEPTIGIITSSTYEIKGGFQYTSIDGGISLDFTSSSLNLGILSTTTVSQATTTATVTTESDTGYTLAISSISESLLTSVTDSDASVTAGVEEYGIGLIGDNRFFENDRSVEVRNISTASTAVTADETQIIFKAAISSTSTAGELSQTVVFTASVNP